MTADWLDDLERRELLARETGRLARQAAKAGLSPAEYICRSVWEGRRPAAWIRPVAAAIAIAALTPLMQSCR